MQALRGNTYVREIRTEDAAKRKPIFFTQKGISLRSVLQETLPGNSIIPRGKVDLNSPIDVAANGMQLQDFIEYIEGTRDLVRAITWFKTHRSLATTLPSDSA